MRLREQFCPRYFLLLDMASKDKILWSVLSPEPSNKVPWLKTIIDDS